MQHRQESLLPATHALQDRWLRLAKNMSKHAESLLIIEVEHPADCRGQPVIVGPRRTLLEASLPAKTHPATSAPAIEIIEIQSRLLEEFAEGTVAQPSELRDQASPVDPQRRTDIAQYQVGRYPIKVVTRSSSM
jgi:hypothetical protein